MDKDGSGVIDINDLRGRYNAKFHPDVRQGKKTEDEVLAEFESFGEGGIEGGEGAQGGRDVNREGLVECDDVMGSDDSLVLTDVLGDLGNGSSFLVSDYLVEQGQRISDL